jgi:hypothetical protein
MMTWIALWGKKTMPRPNSTAPDPRVVIVRPDEDKDYFEVYLMEPIKVGAMTKLGHAHYGTEDGSSGFKNMADACEFILTRFGKPEIASKLAKYMTARRGDRKPPTAAPISGAELLRSGKWLDYCAAYGRDPGSVRPTQLYPITFKEREEWGIK